MHSCPVAEIRFYLPPELASSTIVEHLGCSYIQTREQCHDKQIKKWAIPMSTSWQFPLLIFRKSQFIFAPSSRAIVTSNSHSYPTMDIESNSNHRQKRPESSTDYVILRSSRSFLSKTNPNTKQIWLQLRNIFNTNSFTSFDRAGREISKLGNGRTRWKRILLVLQLWNVVNHD